MPSLIIQKSLPHLTLLSLQTVFCLLACLVMFCWKSDMIHCVKATEVNRPLVWGFTFIWLGDSCGCQRLKFPPVSLYLSPLLTSGFPRDSLSRVWVCSSFSCNSLLVKLGEGKCSIILLGLSPLVRLCPWTVTFTNASCPFSPFRWNKNARGWSWLFSFSHID